MGSQKKPARPAMVLIVEDNRESIELLSYFLRPAGYKIITAEDGATALEAVKKTPPDIILLDVMLPRVDGYQVCEHLKNNRKTFHIPIIMITALKELKDKLRALQAGADDFVSKPFDSVELLVRVKSLLRIKRYHDELQQQNRLLLKQKHSLEREDQLKKELINLIVHDMKNPIFVIQGNLQMMNMIRESGESAEEEKYTSRIERSSRGLLRMILNLLDISRLELESMQLEPQPIDIHALVNEAVTYQQDNPHHVNKKCDLELARILPAALVDKAVFERVLDNLFFYLFQNAAEYSRITVRTSITEKGFILLSVSHAGTHIPREFHEKVFTKLAQSELQASGLKLTRGLGLIFCRLALRAHQGDMIIDPYFKGGTRFVLSIPASPSRPLA